MSAPESKEVITNITREKTPHFGQLMNSTLENMKLEESDSKKFKIYNNMLCIFVCLKVNLFIS